MKVVLDSNVLLAGFAAHGLCEGLLEVCLVSHTIVLSEHILAELGRNLERKLKMAGPLAREIVGLLREQGLVVVPADVSGHACRDPSDLPVLGTAIAAGADCLVSGDADLLELGAFGGIPILSPRQFYDRKIRLQSPAGGL